MAQINWPAPDRPTAIVRIADEREREAEIERLKEELAALRRFAVKSLNDSIGTTDKIVSGLTKRLSAADNVPPSTVASILEHARSIYENARREIAATNLGKEKSVELNLLQKLISVDIKTSIARTQMSLGELRAARETLADSERERKDVCDKTGSDHCRLRALSNARLMVEVAMSERPLSVTRLGEVFRETGKLVADADPNREIGALRLSETRDATELFGSETTNELFRNYWRAQTERARLLLRLAESRSGTLAPAQKRSLLSVADTELASACQTALRPRKNAQQGYVEDILGRDRKVETALGEQTAIWDALREARAECLLVRSRIMAASSAYESTSDAERMRREARDLVDQALNVISTISADARQKLPLQSLTLHARIQRGLLRLGGSVEDEEAFRQTLSDYREKVTQTKFRHATLDLGFLELVDRIRERTVFGGLSGSRTKAAGLPDAEHIALLKAGIRILMDKIARLDAVKQAAQDAAGVSEERQALSQALAVDTKQLFALLYQNEEFQQIIGQYELVRNALPRILPTTKATDQVFDSVMSVEYWAGKASRERGREADAIDIFARMERIVAPLLSTTEDANGMRFLRYLHAHAISSLGDIQMSAITDGVQLDDALSKALELVDAAQGSDSDNIEFQFALGKVLFNQALRQLQRGESVKAQALLERAHKLGADQASQRLISWARNGTGPDGRVDLERAERYARERRQNTPMPYDLHGTSQIFDQPQRFKIYISQVGERGIEPLIDRELRRLERYYAATDFDQGALARLRDIHQKARREVGEGALITQSEMASALRRLSEELAESEPYREASGTLAGALSRADIFIADGDFGRALDTLNGVRPSEQIDTTQTLIDWGYLGLHYLKLAEAIPRDDQGGSAQREIDLIERAKTESQRALTRATDLRLLSADRSPRRRQDLFDSLRKLAVHSNRMDLGLRSRFNSFETNKTYELRFNELARQFLDMATAQLSDDGTTRDLDRSDIIELINARLLMSTYARRGAEAMRRSAQELQSVKTRLFSRSLRELSSALSLLEDQARGPDPENEYDRYRLLIQNSVAETHDAFDETGVALRLALETIEDAAKLVEANRDNLKLRETKAKTHELVAYIAFKLAEEDFQQMRLMLRETNLDQDANVIQKMKNPKATLEGPAVPSFISGKYRSSGENFDRARQHYAEAIDLREQVLAIEPDAFCPCHVNKNVHRLALTAFFQKTLEFPRRADLPAIETYLCNRIERWRARAKDDLSPESTRHARWYLARALALRDDAIRQDLKRRGESFSQSAYSFCPHEARTGLSIASADIGQNAGDFYDAADEQFRMISAPDNEMLADHALLLSDKAYYHLSRGFDGVLEADRAIIEAYEIWLRLPYSVWNTLDVSDLNIPANYAHVFYVKSLREESKTSDDYRQKAEDIYRKYVGYRLQRNDSRQRATWINLVREDIDRLRLIEGYAELKNPFANNTGLQ